MLILTAERDGGFRMLRKLLFCLAMLVVAGPAAADDAMRCSSETGDVTIAACTRAINSGAGRPSINYNNRGYAYREQRRHGPCHCRLHRGDTARSQICDCVLQPRLAYSDKGEMDRAIADYHRGDTARSQVCDGVQQPGLSLPQTKANMDRAIADYTEAIRLDPKYAIAYSNRGLAYRDKGEHDRAIADYTEAIRLDPKYANAYNNRGLAYWRKGENDRAIADYTEAIRLDPKYANAYNNRGLAYRDKGDTDRAIADFTEAIRLDPKFAHAYVNRGLAYEKLADFARARADYNATLGLSQKGTEWAQDKARERLAALPSPPPATASSEKSNVADSYRSAHCTGAE